MRTNIYIDGFNLYHGSLQHSSNKWLDLRLLAQQLLPGHSIEQVKFFTAKVSARTDADQPNRQMMYWRALRTTRVEITEGNFQVRSSTMPINRECKQFDANKRVIVKVDKAEEKGSDVNLATHLLVDGFQGRYEQAAVITNNSDLALPLEIVTRQLGLRLALLNPLEHHSKKLVPFASTLARIRETDLANAQFSEVLKDSEGRQIKKPAIWGSTFKNSKTFHGGRMGKVG